MPRDVFNTAGRTGAAKRRWPSNPLDPRRSKTSEVALGRRVRHVLFAAGALLLGACFSPASPEAHVCRSCVESCAEGLVCREGRCLLACTTTCGDENFRCDDGACVPVSGGPACSETVVRLSLCVGDSVEREVADPDQSWELAHSSLPPGLEFRDGRIEGTPEREATGSLSVVSGPDHAVVTVELTATMQCPSIVTPSFSWCAGEASSAALEAAGGGELSWHVEGLPPGVVHDGGDLTGSVSEPGEYRLRVTLRDEHGTRAERDVTLEVRPCSPEEPPPGVSEPLPEPPAESDAGSQGDEPDAGAPPADPPHEPPAPLEPLVIVPDSLPSVCISRDFFAQLGVEGDADDLLWRIDEGPGWLEIDELTGELFGTADADEGVVIVHVEDGRGAVGTATFEIELLTRIDPTCLDTPPSIETGVLPRACVGQPYEETLVATGGRGPYYYWTTSSPLPEGLTLSIDGIVSGTPTRAAVGEHSMTVNVQSGDILDDISAVASRTLRLTVSACEELVFVAEDEAADRLFFAIDGEPGVTEVSASVLAAGERVVSFALAPDAPRVAFLVGASLPQPGEEPEDATSTRLYLVSALGAEEPVLVSSSGASVLEYSWAPDGEHLAFVERSGTLSSLATVPAGESEVGATADVSARHLADLVWAADRLCYKAPGALSTQRSVMCHEVPSAGVQDPALASGLFTARDLNRAILFGGTEGYLAAIDARFVFYQDIQTGLGARYSDHIFSPSLRWASAVTETDPSIREIKAAAVFSQSNVPLVLASLSDCTSLHAWSRDDRRLACTAGDDLTLVELTEAGALERASAVATSAGYPAAGFRRAFSDDGLWYAYDTAPALRVVRTDAETPAAAAVLGDTAPAVSGDLRFSGSGQWLFSHRGGQLRAIRLDSELAASTVSQSVLLREPSPCSEAYLPIPRAWCGAAAVPSSAFVPSPNTDSVAFVDREGFLNVASAATSSPPRRVHDQRVKCTNDLGELRCDEYIRWAPQRF